MKHILSLYTYNNPGVISRVSGLFRRRGYNIDSFIGSSTEDENFSRLTMVVEGEDIVISQVINQLEKLEDIISAEDVSSQDKVSKVLLYMKVKAEDKEARENVILVANACGAQIDDLSPEYLVVEALQEEEKILDMIEIFKPYGIIELAKTGVIAMKK